MLNYHNKIKGELPQSLPQSQASQVSATRLLNILYSIMPDLSNAEIYFLYVKIAYYYTMSNISRIGIVNQYFFPLIRESHKLYLDV